MPAAPEDTEDDIAEERPGLHEDTAFEDAFEASLLLEGDTDMDDSVASDLEHGISVSEDDTLEEDSAEVTLDMESAFAVDPDSAESEGDEQGPLVEEGDADVGADEAFDSDETEGAVEDGDLGLEDLPSLGVDPGEGEAEVALESFELSTAPDEELPPRADLGFTETPLPAKFPRCTALSVERGGSMVLAGGQDVFLVDDAGSRLIVARALGDTVTSLVGTGDPATVLFTTQDGDLYRAAAGKDAPERVVAFLDTVDTALAGAPEISLGGPTPSQRPAVLLHLKEEGVLLETTDQGTTWRRVDLGGKVLALSSGSPPVCLVETGRGLRFFVSETSGGFSPVGAVFSGESESLSVTTLESVIVVLSPGHGVSVSADRGGTFRSADRCTLATAVTAGSVGKRLFAFASLWDESTGRATLVWIDPGTGKAFAIASIDGALEEDDEDTCRVSALAWEPHTETLWAAGRFGLLRFRRPASA